MSATTMLHVRVDDEVKEQAAKAFERMGLTMSEGLRVFLRRVAADQALPFALQVPNATTWAAMEEARSMSARFQTGEELMDNLSGNRR